MYSNVLLCCSSAEWLSEMGITAARKIITNVLPIHSFIFLVGFEVKWSGQNAVLPSNQRFRAGYLIILNISCLHFSFTFHFLINSLVCRISGCGQVIWIVYPLRAHWSNNLDCWKASPSSVGSAPRQKILCISSSNHFTSIYLQNCCLLQGTHVRLASAYLFIYLFIHSHRISPFFLSLQAQWNVIDN